MVEEAMQHEIDALRKLLVEKDLAQAPTMLQAAKINGVYVTQSQHDRSVDDLKEQLGLARSFSQEISSLRVFVTSQIEKAIENLKAQNTTIRDMNRVGITERLDAADKAEELKAAELLRRQEITDAAIIDIKHTLDASDGVVDQRAQAANDALERLLNSAIASTIAISDERYNATQLAITKGLNSTELAITKVEISGKAALDAALMAANSAVDAVKTQLLSAVASLKELIDLRAQMTADAVSKANDANEKRFESVNEFRAQLGDQTRQFVTSVVLDAKMDQVLNTQKTLDAQSRIDVASLAARINQLDNRITSMQSADATKREVRTDNNMTMGSITGIAIAGAAVLGIIITLGGSFIHQSGGSASDAAIAAAAAAERRAVSDKVDLLLQQQHQRQ